MTAYNRYTLNVGLVNTAGNITATAAREALTRAGVKIITSNVLRSDTEPTLIALVGIACGSLTSALFHVCDALGQDCIAVANEKLDDGILVGPNAVAWGEFNPKFFLTLSGRRLSDVRDAGRKLAPKDAYQGHLPGSGVQAHSAGGLFPWVVYAQECTYGVKFGFLAPDGTDSGPLYTYGAAVYMAERDKECHGYRLANKARNEAFRKGREAALAAARVNVPEPVVEDGARCLLCDHPIPDVPEHKNSHWFEKRDFPPMTVESEAALLRMILETRRYI